MIKKRWAFLFLGVYLLMGAAFITQLLQAMKIPPIDIAAINRAAKETEQQWATGIFKKPDGFPYEYAVITNEGAVLFETAPSVPITVLDSAREHGSIIDIVVDHTIRGKLLVATGYDRAFLRQKSRLACYAFFLLLLLVIPVIFYTLYLNRAVVKPFRNLREFARQVALGNLDFPLPMDKNHIFGAFTESFDIMRDQLQEAKLRETAANRSKKELVASLSHDIKTPVASIKLTGELLLVTETDPRVRERLQTIYQKSEQIDRLITNMLQSSLEDLEELSVTRTETESSAVETIIREADYRGRLAPFSIPGCLLSIDPFRMEQVIGNIINNSYKYADTDLSVTAELTEDGLRLEFLDYGKGVPEEELPLLFQKFYRGKKTEKSCDGSGLGLYISRYLMERMGGMIECINRENGFSVILYLPLIHPELL